MKLKLVLDAIIKRGIKILIMCSLNSAQGSSWNTASHHANRKHNIYVQSICFPFSRKDCVSVSSEKLPCQVNFLRTDKISVIWHNELVNDYKAYIFLIFCHTSDRNHNKLNIFHYQNGNRPFSNSTILFNLLK